MDSFKDIKRKTHIGPQIIPNSEDLYFSLLNIEHSFTGRMDAKVANLFIMESNQMLVNSLSLFEMGYFDCAFYSLRAALEQATLLVYLSDLPEIKREQQLAVWRGTDRFPMKTQMLSELKADGDIFRDMIVKMPAFFEDARKVNDELNKIVHKQGEPYLYVARSNPFLFNKSDDTLLEDFLRLFKKCVGIVAVMRLAIDPFPILLMDEEIRLRAFDTMTDPYDEEFVNEYIGENTVAEYKLTDNFIDHAAYYLSEPKKSIPTYNVMKFQYIDTNERDSIEAEYGLLEPWDVIASKIAFRCNKVVKIYAYGGLLMYFTDRKTNRTDLTFSSETFKDFANNPQKMNLQYDEALISVFPFNNEFCWVEHDSPLELNEIDEINEILFEALE
jgi:hypothetical protein